MSLSLSTKIGAKDCLRVLARCGWKPKAPRTREPAVWLEPAPVCGAFGLSLQRERDQASDLIVSDPVRGLEVGHIH